MADDITDEQVLTKWAEIAELIEVVVNRIQTPNEFSVQPGSELAAADDATDPFQISHAARWCLNAGLDHLHALKSLAIDANPNLIHGYADYSLVRGALENFGAGFWILHPADPITRIEHGLRWWLKNVRDSDNAVRDLARPDYQPLQRRLERIIDIGLAAGCDLQALNNRYFSTPVMEYANHHSSASNPQLIWKICSGFAHGRPWASIGMNHMERNGNDDERGVSEVRFTSDHKRLLGVALPAFRLMTDLVRLMQDRSVRRNLDTESVRRL